MISPTWITSELARFGKLLVKLDISILAHVADVLATPPKSANARLLNTALQSIRERANIFSPYDWTISSLLENSYQIP